MGGGLYFAFGLDRCRLVMPQAGTPDGQHRQLVDDKCWNRDDKEVEHPAEIRVESDGNEVDEQAFLFSV